MRVKDEHLWSNQLLEFTADEMSQKFSDFLVFWCEAADTMIAESNPPLTEHSALSKAFEVAEQTFGFLSVEWLGQMLLVIVQHWERGDPLWESLTVFERRMVEQATALKIVELQESAAQDPENATDVS